MEPEREIPVERAGKTEPDWYAASLSSTGLPSFVDGEFRHMVELESEGEDASERPLEAGAPGNQEALSEKEMILELAGHMDALLKVAGKNQGAKTDGQSGLLKRFASRLAGE
jgi:hypothetical protein